MDLTVRARNLLSWVFGRVVDVRQCLLNRHRTGTSGVRSWNADVDNVSVLNIQRLRGMVPFDLARCTCQLAKCFCSAGILLTLLDSKQNSKKPESVQVGQRNFEMMIKEFLESSCGLKSQCYVVQALVLHCYFYPAWCHYTAVCWICLTFGNREECQNAFEVDTKACFDGRPLLVAPAQEPKQTTCSTPLSSLP